MCGGARLVAGEDALVIGGGPIGMLIAMVAGRVGAKVTVSEVNAHRLELAQSFVHHRKQVAICSVCRYHRGKNPVDWR
jgi:threonine dehydrogenase-like Zn-dependent dehydrogenase